VQYVGVGRLGQPQADPVEQVFRLVTQPPQRLSMDTLAALCDILDRQLGDLIEVKKVSRPVRKAAGSGAVPPPVRRSTIRRPGNP
jgi:hypothetical protein